ARRGIRLDEFFALNSTLAPLQEAYRAGHLAIVHAVGSPDRTHSHFEAMATMERGVEDGGTAATGWLGRHLQHSAGRNHSPLRAIAIGDPLPASLEGTLGATAVHSLNEFRLSLPTSWTPGFRGALAGLYEQHDDALGSAGRETLRLLKSLERLHPDRYRP